MQASATALLHYCYRLEAWDYLWQADWVEAG